VEATTKKEVEEEEERKKEFENEKREAEEENATRGVSERMREREGTETGKPGNDDDEVIPIGKTVLCVGRIAFATRRCAARERTVGCPEGAVEAQDLLGRLRPPGVREDQKESDQPRGGGGREAKGAEFHRRRRCRRRCRGRQNCSSALVFRVFSSKTVCE